MPEPDLVDNDVVFKLSCYDLGAVFQGTFEGREKPRRLGLAQFVLPKKIRKSSRVRDKDAAQRNLEVLLAWAEGIEPTDAELALAAEIEDIARTGNLTFDSGESQLLAVLLVRGPERLYTGDKRAIVALRTITVALAREVEVAGRVVCFEQVLMTLLELLGDKELAARVCREADVDKTAAICCGCASGGSDKSNIIEGFQSYIAHLREHSGTGLSA